jgi:hypothetical protein
MPPSFQTSSRDRARSWGMPPSFQTSSRDRARSWGDDTHFQNKLEMRLEEIDEQRKERNSFQADRVRDATIAALKKRAFHLPNNETWCQDWGQYMANNHPFFGIFLSPKLSPVGFGERIIGLTTSLLIGITATNIVMLWKNLDDNMNEVVLSLELSDFFEFSLGLLILWAGISCLHAAHDALVWYLCCAKIKLGYLLWLFLWVGAAVMIIAVSIDQPEPYDPIEVLIYAGIEVAVSWLFWYPLVATILFSGILGCNVSRFPVLGGRPRQVRLRRLESPRQRETMPMNTLSALNDYDASTVARTLSP